MDSKITETQQAVLGKRRAAVASAHRGDDASEAPSATRSRIAAPPTAVHIGSTPASPATDALGRERSASATPLPATTTSPVRGRRLVDAPQSPKPGCDAEALRVYVQAMFDNVGGVLATMLIRPDHVVPRERAAAVRRLAEAAIVALLVLTGVLGPLLRLVPVFGPPETVSLGEVGVELEIPSRLLPESGGTHSVTVRGMPAWTTSEASEEFAFAGLDVLGWELAEHGDPLTGEHLARHWGRRIAGEAKVVEPPAPRGPAWTAHALSFHDTEGVARYLLVEQHLLRGRYLNRVGYVVALDTDGVPGRRVGLFEDIVGSARIGEPPDLAEARTEHLRNAASARLRLELAEALHDVGDFEQADAIYALVLEDEGRLVPEAVVGRLAMWRLHPGAFDVDERPWFLPWLQDYPADRGLQEDGILTLATAGHCGVARAAHERFAAARPDAAEVVTTAGAVMKCEVLSQPLRGGSPDPLGPG